MSALRKETIDYDYGQEYAKKIKKTRIKKKKKNKIVIDSLKNTFMLAAAFVLGIVIIYNYAVITDKKMEINDLNQEIATMNDDIDELNIDLESIKNTNKIEEMAKTYLGMNYPTRKQTVFLNFQYGESDKAGEVDVAAADENILYGLIDKVIGFVR